MSGEGVREMNEMTLASHPIDRALAAIAEAVMLALASKRPSRFSEAEALSRLESRLQRLRPAKSIADVEDGVKRADDDEEDMGADGEDFPNAAPYLPRRRFNDAADLNREILMLAQGFFSQYMEVERLKVAATPDVRLNEVLELAALVELRLKLMKEGQPVPAEIDAREEQLRKRIGEERHAQPQSSPVVPPEPVRGHPADGTGAADADRVREPDADRA